ncbi:unknown protein [Parachlamydia acanthamoebae UV-7]|uniref:Uncharacterized protein n=1 Tax=Parachlamydia acanthamoebae (strain UV7) TaxID=765952 RepID=F8KWT5_PARAV|nr:hypothetical protein [Parachlamydia acanthamoebae]CCB86368.1 unknown protein [Parachlamydia acanthamoebae UV-7]
MSINFEGNIESGRLKFDANFSENKGIKDKGIKVNKGITKFAKNAFAAIGLGGGTIKIFGPDNKALHINKQSAIKWIKAHGEKADTENVDKLSSKAVGEKVAYLYVQKKQGKVREVLSLNLAICTKQAQELSNLMKKLSKVIGMQAVKAISQAL